MGEEKPRILNHNYYAETFAPEEEKVMPMIFVVNDALLDSEAMYLEINPTGAVIDNPDYDIRRYIVLNWWRKGGLSNKIASPFSSLWKYNLRKREKHETDF